MQSRTLTLRVPPETAKAYESASSEERQRVDDALLSRLRELTEMLPSTPPPSDAGASAAPSQAVRQPTEAEIHPEVSKISGLVPPDVDARAEYRAYLLNKHR